MTNLNTNEREPIAIVGIGCRFPGGVDSPRSFWNLLTEGVDAITEVPEDRWSQQRFFDPNRGKPGKTYTKWGGFLDSIDLFDASFFGISPREASMLDPQQRLLLEVCWEALEDGGQRADKLRGSRTGVFIGGFTLDYKYLQFAERNRHVVGSHTATGVMMTLLANRLSYVFDFQGPSVAVDTACSSSLVAVHLACQSLWNGETGLAIAGGVNVMLKPDITVSESKAGMLSPDGRSRAFDSRANGYVRAEGAGIVVLKPFAQAVADGDSIYALIRGTAVNQDGNSSGLTVPRGEAQEKLMREAYARAGVKPSEIQYVEAHGTGTPVGDPIEANAIGTVLSDGRGEQDVCYIGSVKTNFGHTEAAAGVAGLIKAALALHHGQIPKHLHLLSANPKIDLEQLKLKVPQELTPWPETEGPRLAGVNSFGFGGTNAHAVLEAAPIPAALKDDVQEQASYRVVPLSARSPEALQQQASTWMRELGDGGLLEGASLSDLAHWASQRRDHHPHRLAVLAKSSEDLLDSLQAYLNQESRPGLAAGQAGNEPEPLVFVYTGMGPQWWGMGQQLYREEPVFRAALDDCDARFQKQAGWSVLEEMLKDESRSRMAETEVAQPANFFLQVGLTELWKSYGVVPDAIVGHSAGEAAACYVAGAMSLDEAIKVIYHRSRLQQLTTGQGKLVAVSLPHQDVLPYLKGLEDRVSIAALNSPSSVTLVGDPDALELVVAPLEAKGVFCKYLFVKVPYHSHYMDPLREELLEVLGDLQLTDTHLPLYSTVTGRRIEGTQADAHYWWLNVRDSVLFAAATNELLQDGYSRFLEVGPHPVLASSISECLDASNRSGKIATSMRRGQDEQQILLGSLGQLYTGGQEVEWAALNPTGRAIKLPGYPWQRERHWNESHESAQDRLGEKRRPLLGNRLHVPHPAWETEINTSQITYLADHQIQSSIVFPGAAYFEMVCQGINDLLGAKPGVIYGVGEVEFHKALFLSQERNANLQLHLDPEAGTYRIVDATNPAADLPLHSSGKVLWKNRYQVPKVSLSDLQVRLTSEVTKEQTYEHFRKLGLVYGPTFQGIERLWHNGQGEVLVQIRVPDAILPEMGDYEMHPVVLDYMFQSLAAALPREGEETVYMPTGIDHGIFGGTIRSQVMWIHAKICEQTDVELTGDIRLFDEEGNTLFEVAGCRARSLKDDSQQVMGNVPMTYSELSWVEQELMTDTEAANTGDLWLLCTDRDGVGTRLAERLRENGDRAIMVQAGSQYSKVAEDLYAVRPGSTDDYHRLLTDLQAENGHDPLHLRGIVHLYSLDIADTVHLTDETLAQAEVLGGLSVLHLTQAVAQYPWRKAPKMWLVTSGAQTVANEAGTQVAQSTLWGLARVIGQQEHRDIWGGIVDLDPASAVDESAALLAKEIRRTDREDQVAYRNRVRYVARLVDCQDLSLPLPPQLRQDASYMITGGFGALGLLVAAHLIERGARRLILVGREALPPRIEWKQVDPDSRTGQRIASVRALEALGASVHVAGFDVADAGALAAFVEAYEAEGWPSIRGIIHSAGTSKPQMLLSMTADEYASVLRPKVQGAWNLHTQFHDAPLDFFILFSSVASLIVSPGQGNYAAGNEFLNALARYRHALGKPALSINWGPWGEVGMANDLDLIEFFAKRGNYPITNAKGLEAFGHVMGHSKPQVMVSPLVWNVACQTNYPLGEFPAMLDDVYAQSAQQQAKEEPETGKENIRESLQNESDPVLRQELLEAYVKDSVSHVLLLNREQLVNDEPLTSMGLDSMLALELRSRLEKTFGVSVPVVELLRGVSVKEISHSLNSQMQTEISSGDDVLSHLDHLKPEDLDDLSDEEIERLLQELEAN
ncbi:type I polyketide synthase [Tumebacillus sp. DT12]|uniref:Type I polyketide synthase n=1 Tax=Tumebacillus lacus TaxID=2995335 RepID=A0ABT3X3U4_9BACL|nr:type I polyketide synthase [Tumebacillus lacus]MCX7569419.1 type I polyketide synthase [Tumebacillus lacus]